MTDFRKRLSSSILCANNCGFYGNPSWDGLCSVCYRNANPNGEGPRTTADSRGEPVSSQALSKFVSRRKLSAKSNKVTKDSYPPSSELKNFRYSKNQESNEQATIPYIPEESFQATNEFNDFLITLRPTVSSEISRQVNKLLDELEAAGDPQLNRYSLIVQRFYGDFVKYMSTSTIFAFMPKDLHQRIMDAIERFITIRIYHWAFASPITDDESIDLKLQEKLRSLTWVTPSLLDSPVNPKDANQIDLLEQSMIGFLFLMTLSDDDIFLLLFASRIPLTNRIDSDGSALNGVNAVYASEDKLDKISVACMKVFEALRLNPTTTTDSAKQQSSSIDSTRADDFLPTLIWVVMNANAPMLHSNIQFVMRFANQHRLNMGQTAFFFTNLSGAVHFLIHLDHKSLNLSEEDFVRYTRIGIPVTKGAEFPPAVHLCADNEIALLDLEQKVSDLELKTESLGKSMASLADNVERKTDTLRQQFPLKSLHLDPRSLETPHILLLGPVPSNTTESPFDDDSINRQLPSPLKPTKTGWSAANK